jgi:uncharacterized repeat protein (TIGR03803 family)
MVFIRALGYSILAAALAVVLPSKPAFANQLRPLHKFHKNGKSGYLPNGGVILDSAGNLYGTTVDGGGNGCNYVGCGTVFELSPSGKGQLTMTILHSFRPKAKDGEGPMASLTFDTSGNLFGTTVLGGKYGYGTVFELSPGAGGKWTEKVLLSFNSTGQIGYFPVGNLTFDASGNLYGTASQGGIYGLGVVFELSPTKSGRWGQNILHSFGNGTDGAAPLAGVVFDASGNLYGTTQYGGPDEAGTVFRLSPNSDGTWTEKVLYNFKADGKDGTAPQGNVVLDGAGNLYSTTTHGGTSTQCSGGCGTVFELTPAGNQWKEQVLHVFGLTQADSALPWAGLTFDTAGNLYGTSLEGGGGGGGSGTIFEMLPGTDGQWTETVAVDFGVNGGKDGFYPTSGLILDSAGRIYGTAQAGGVMTDCSGLGCGTVYRFTP